MPTAKLEETVIRMGVEKEKYTFNHNKTIEVPVDNYKKHNFRYSATQNIEFTWTRIFLLLKTFRNDKKYPDTDCHQ